MITTGNWQVMWKFGPFVLRPYIFQGVDWWIVCQKHIVTLGCWCHSWSKPHFFRKFSDWKVNDLSLIDGIKKDEIKQNAALDFLNCTCQCTLPQGGCTSKNQCLQILIKYTFFYSKWKITLEKGQNWSLCSFKFAYWIDTFLSFTSKIWSNFRNSIIIAFIQSGD